MNPTRPVVLTALVLLCTLSSGCIGAAGPPEWHVRIDSATGFGHGIMLDEHHVLTVQHVTPDNHEGYRITRVQQHVPGQRRRAYRTRIGHVIRRFGSPFAREPFAVLRLTKPLPCDRYPKWRPLRRGDSGSPILGRYGEVVGLVSAGVFPRGSGDGVAAIGICPPDEPDLTLAGQ